MSDIDPVDLMLMLQEHLTIEVGAGSNDPEDDSRTVSIWWDDTKITEATL